MVKRAEERNVWHTDTWCLHAADNHVTKCVYLYNILNMRAYLYETSFSCSCLFDVLSFPFAWVASSVRLCTHWYHEQRYHRLFLFRKKTPLIIGFQITGISDWMWCNLLKSEWCAFCMPRTQPLHVHRISILPSTFLRCNSSGGGGSQQNVQFKTK